MKKPRNHKPAPLDAGLVFSGCLVGMRVGSLKMVFYAVFALLKPALPVFRLPMFWIAP
jgi:hypothetical protein